MILVILYLLNTYCNVNEYFAETNKKIDIEIVVARYNENLKWLNDASFNKYYIKCYNKGSNNDIKINSAHEIINLTNVGRCDHTYLYHIVNNYDNLADFTVFLPGSNDVSYKLLKSKILIKEIEKHNKTIFIGSKFNNIKDDYYNFTLDKYRGVYELNNEFKNNNNLQNDNDNVGKSAIRPFGKWYDYHFGDREIDFASFWGIIALSKKNIRQNSKEYYKRFLEELQNSSNPEVGHYIERSWCAIFYPLNDTIFIDIQTIPLLANF
jgi:hypothetical protein